MRWGIALSALVLLCFAAASDGTGASAATCPANLANQLTDAGSAIQLGTVVAPRGRPTTRSLRPCRRSHAAWPPAHGPWTAHLGPNRGPAAKRQGGIPRPPP